MNDNNKSNELLNKRVLVTGGTKGMGEAIAKQLTQAGAKVFTTARSMPDNFSLKENFSSERKRLHWLMAFHCKEYCYN